MHMRKKKWARPELAECGWFESWPEKLRGSWHDRFPKDQPLHMELGCGKGVSTAQMAHANPDINYLALDISPDVLGDARRNIVAAYGDDPVENIVLVQCDISYLKSFFAPEDRVERLYISFCNPWPRPKHAKRRLTHPRQLLQYRELLADGGEVWFKTDDDGLFRDSLAYFDACGFERVYVTYDLHASGFGPNYVSEHERKFSSQGIPIKLGVFRKLPGEVQVDATRWYDLPEGRRADGTYIGDEDEEREQD